MSSANIDPAGILNRALEYAAQNLRIENLLIEKGYRCAVEHEKLLERSGLFNLYATRGEAGSTVHSRSGSKGPIASVSGHARRINLAASQPTGISNIM